KLTISELKDKTVHAVAGIANPDRFFNQLRKYGVNVIEHPFADHHQFIQADLEFADDFPVLMTEKDAVKCYSFHLHKCYFISVKAALSMDLVDSIIGKLSR
ncbi:MAG: tetraacyldisaccharide 4'-kinase, partial [Pseudomonadota bacterium]